MGQFNPSSGGCYLAHGTLVDQQFPTHKNGLPKLRFGTSYKFFQFPPSAAVGSGAAAPAIQVSADFIGLFNNTPSPRALVRFLTSNAAQRESVTQPHPAAFSPHPPSPSSLYP